MTQEIGLFFTGCLLLTPILLDQFTHTARFLCTWRQAVTRNHLGAAGRSGLARFRPFCSIRHRVKSCQNTTPWKTRLGRPATGTTPASSNTRCLPAPRIPSHSGPDQNGVSAKHPPAGCLPVAHSSGSPSCHPLKTSRSFVKYPLPFFRPSFFLASLRRPLQISASQSFASCSSPPGLIHSGEGRRWSSVPSVICHQHDRAGSPPDNRCEVTSSQHKRGGVLV